MTKQFNVSLEDRPGELAKLSGALAEKGVNIRTAAAATLTGRGVVSLITSDEPKTRDVLRTQRYSFSEDDILVARIDDKPGALAQVAKNLAAARVNVKSLALLSNAGPKVEIALTVDNVEKAKSVVK